MIESLGFRGSFSAFWLQMTNFLNWPKWVVTSAVESDGRQDPIIVEASYLPILKRCPKCTSGGPLYGHGTKTMDFADAPVRGHPVTIKVRVQRYRCRSCRATSLQPLPDMVDDRRMTRRCRQYLEKQVLKKSVARLAEETGIGANTIRRAVADDFSPIIDWPVFAPLILGIDEVRVSGRKPRGMFVDLHSLKVIDLTETNDKAAVIRWLSALDYPKYIFVVCIDGSYSYREAVEEVFGKDKVHIVYDKFHVVRKANHCMSRLKKDAATSAKQGPVTRRLSRRILLKRRKNLSKEEAKKLKTLFRKAPDVKAAYLAKEEFFEIYELKTRRGAERAFAKWANDMTPDLKDVFQPLLTTLKNWPKEILAYWDHPGITNSFTEAMNGQVRRIARAGQGYSFPQLRKRLLDGYSPKPRDAKGAAKLKRSINTVFSCPQCRDRANAMFPHKRIPAIR
jgi:transposase